MQLSDFDFQLPQELIAIRPIIPRSDAKLLVCSGTHIHDTNVNDICSFLRPGDRLILNDTKVIPARLSGTRARLSAQGLMQAKIDITLLKPLSGGQWSALVKPLRKLSVGETIVFSAGLSAICVNKAESVATLAFSVEGDALDVALDVSGQMPLPPYIASKRAADAQDKTDYQTIWARHRGAVAAPTASLHLDATVLASFVARKVDISFVTLHVGAGTFLPVKVENISNHKMHAEWGQVSSQTVDEIKATKASGGRIIPVGTTALRLIETAAKTGTLRTFKGNTDIFIYPGFNFKITDGLMTNFHLPKSTLLMLVAALISKKQLDAVYAHAIINSYRFFSYGDASLLFRQ